MGKGRDKRIIMGLQAELVIGPKKNCRGIICNLSDDGIGVIVETSPTDDSLNFPPDAMVQLNFKPRDEMINLNCEIRWLQAFKNPPHGLTNLVGMKIIDPPENYKKLLETLHYSDKFYYSFDMNI